MESCRPVQVTDFEYTALDDPKKEKVTCEMNPDCRSSGNALETIPKESFSVHSRSGFAVRGAFSLCAAQKFRVTCIHFTYEKAVITRP